MMRRDDKLKVAPDPFCQNQSILGKHLHNFDYLLFQDLQKYDFPTGNNSAS